MSIPINISPSRGLLLVRQDEDEDLEYWGGVVTGYVLVVGDGERYVRGDHVMFHPEAATHLKNEVNPTLRLVKETDILATILKSAGPMKKLEQASSTREL